MCGICGFVCSLINQEEQIRKMTHALRHRGPDFQSYKIIDSVGGVVSLGHARLSILDLSPLGNQPMTFQNLTMVFNGEVYNYKEIRSELIHHGYVFESDSDSEVILKGFHKWGVLVLDRMIGMFAMSILDNEKGELFIARDRLGVKPLFYSKTDDDFYFASELTALSQNQRFHGVIDNDNLYQYLHYGYFPDPNTVYENTFKVMPGHYGVYDLKTKSLKFTKYWSAVDFHNLDKFDKSEDEIISDLDDLFKRAFNYRMISDVPVGVFLSGGYDSSLVSAILQNTNSTQIKTFTIGFGEREFNEAEDAKRLAEYLGTDHHEYYCTPTDGMDIIPSLGSLYDEPFGDSSAIPTVLLSRFCRQHVSVALSADGGDEIFAGYNNYSSFSNLVQKLNGLKEKSPRTVQVLAKTVNMTGITNAWAPKRRHLYSIALDYLGNDDLKGLLRNYRFQNHTGFMARLFKEPPNMPSSSFDSLKHLENQIDPVENSQFLDLITYLPSDILTKVDRATMSVSLEGREPLLDHQIVEYAARVPTHMHFKGGVKKHLLKEVTHKYIPKHLLDRPKKGFGIPIQSWMRNELKDITIDYLNKESLGRSGLFNENDIIKLRDSYLNGDTANFELIWYILAFQLWYTK